VKFYAVTRSGYLMGSTAPRLFFDAASGLWHGYIPAGARFMSAERATAAGLEWFESNSFDITTCITERSHNTSTSTHWDSETEGEHGEDWKRG
jgi:hypothetical protein